MCVSPTVNFLSGHRKNTTDTRGVIHPAASPHPTKPGACVVCTLVLLKATWLHSLGPKACGFLFDWQNVSPPLPSFLSPVTALLIPVTSYIPSAGIKGWSGCSALSRGEITKRMTYWFLFFFNIRLFMQHMNRWGARPSEFKVELRNAWWRLADRCQNKHFNVSLIC